MTVKVIGQVNAVRVLILGQVNALPTSVLKLKSYICVYKYDHTTLCLKKVCRLMFEDKFGKRGLIFKILSHVHKRRLFDCTFYKR